MIKRPEFIKSGDTIGITAPSFGPTVEPYKSMYEVAVKKLEDRGYKVVEGETVHKGDGLGISTDPKVTGRELTEFYLRDDIDAIISAGGGELMNETITNVDFEALKQGRPKWYLGYSDNTNFIFPLVTITGVMGIYGPCICHFAKKWELPEADAFELLEGTKKSFTGYDQYVRPGERKESTGDEDFDIPYAYDAKKILRSFDCSTKKAHLVGDETRLSMKGVFIGGCLDVLANLVGTRFDNMKKFNEENKEVIWMLEACDLSTLSIRRAIWNLREAGWFDSAAGFLIGRPLAAFESDLMGVDSYNAVTDMLSELGKPIIMDADFGHIDPQLPLVMGASANVSAIGNQLEVEYLND